MKLSVFVGGLFCGGLTGYAVAALTAPKTGDLLRRDLVEASDSFYRKAVYELEDLQDKAEELKEKIDDLKHKSGLLKTRANAQFVIDKSQISLDQHEKTLADSTNLLAQTKQISNSASGF